MIVGLLAVLAVFAFWMAFNYVITAHVSGTKKQTIWYHTVGIIMLLASVIFLLLASMV